MVRAGTYRRNNEEDRRGPGLSLFWFSQVIGLNRGLQDVIRRRRLACGDVQCTFVETST